MRCGHRCNPAEMARGIFISFEGSEGGGKSTQIALLESALQERGITVRRTREPGGTLLGERLRDLLQHTPELEDLCDEAELLLFGASRAQLVREVIRPALESGTWVIADRFLDSTTVYQGIGRGLGAESVNAVNAVAVGASRPDVTFLLDLDAATGHARARAASGDRPDRIENQPPAFFERIRARYLDLAAANPDRIVLIDASRPVAAVADAIWKECERRFSHELHG